VCDQNVADTGFLQVHLSFS